MVLSLLLLGLICTLEFDNVFCWINKVRTALYLFHGRMKILTVDYRTGIRYPAHPREEKKAAQNPFLIIHTHTHTKTNIHNRDILPSSSSFSLKRRKPNATWHSQQYP